MSTVEKDLSQIKTDVAVIQTNIVVIQSDVRELRGEMKAANQAIAGLEKQGIALQGEMNTIRQEIRATKAELHTELHTLINQQTKWMIGTCIALTTAAFSIAKFVGG